MAERFLAERFNRPGHELVDHHVYVICSDGDLMEGISQEAASIAGHFGLGKLVVCYDDNRITIDGTTSISFDGENHTARLEADGWHVQRVEDSEDLDALQAAIAAARDETERPSFIAIRSHIAYPAPHAVDTAKAHGAALGEDEVRATKEVMGFDPDRKFWVDERVYEHMSLHESGTKAQRRLEREVRGVAGGLPGHGSGLGPRVGGAAARGLARVAAGVRRRRGDRHPLGRPEGDGGVRAVRPDDDRRRGGPGRVDQDPVRGRRRVLEGPRGPQHPVRHPRARDGRDRQRRLRARRHRQAVRLDVPDVLRLHARRGAAVGADGPAGGVGVDARLGGRRRGRPDAPADRALRVAARDPAACG